MSKKTKTPKATRFPRTAQALAQELPAAAKAPDAETPKGKKAKKEPKAKKVSALDAAAKVLGEAGTPLNCQEMIDTMAEKGYWKSPGGKTPHATLYAAILREINVKGKEARFTKTERGKFALKA